MYAGACRCSLAGQDGSRQLACYHLEDVVDAVEETRTVRDSAERAAAALTTTTNTLTHGHAGASMYLPEAAVIHHHPSNRVQPMTVETARKPEADDRPSAESRHAELADYDASATVERSSDNEDGRHCQPEITSSLTQPEVVARHPVNRKSTCQEPTSERFDRVVQYFDSRQHISGIILICTIVSSDSSSVVS